MAIMDDFVGFSFNNHHSSEYGVLRVSDGSRYQETLIPTSEDYTVDIPGGDGQYYFGSNFKSKSFNIQIAFDSITEIGLRKIRQWLGINKTGELIFDEEPYKVYNVKVTSEPNLSYICFREKGKRVYKGEGTISFTAFYPFAHARKNNATNEPYGLDWYINQNYKDTEEWSEASGLLNYYPSEEGYNFENTSNNTIKLYNCGDREVPFILSFKKTTAGPFQIDFQMTTSNGSFTISADNSEDSENEVTSPTDMEKIVSNKGIITIDTYKNKINFIYPLIEKDGEWVIDENNETTISTYFLLEKGRFFNIPIEDTIEQKMSISRRGASGDATITDIKISYNYLYY